MSELGPTITELEPTATERLRALLAERGVEWDADDEAMDDGSLSQVTYWYCNGIEWSADGRDEYLAFDAVQLLTPEQAIAATLGADAKPTQAESSVALTAEQVRDAVMLADRWEKPMGNTGLTNTHLIIRDDGWQAIADELNNTLGSFNCTNDCTNAERTETCEYCANGKFDGQTVMMSNHGWQRINFCPNCGRRIEVDDG